MHLHNGIVDLPRSAQPKFVDQGRQLTGFRRPAPSMHPLTDRLAVKRHHARYGAGRYLPNLLATAPAAMALANALHRARPLALPS